MAFGSPMAARLLALAEGSVTASTLRLALKTRDDVTGGVTLFHSVCRAWRAAARDVPRLLLLSPQGDAAPQRGGSDNALIFLLARGWSAVVDVRDTPCPRLSHLATGATAALPNLTAIRATPTSTSEPVRRLGERPAAELDRGVGGPPERRPRDRTGRRAGVRPRGSRVGARHERGRPGGGRAVEARGRAGGWAADVMSFSTCREMMGEKRDRSRRKKIGASKFF
ncbi:hypothetical protein C2845_PM04G19690 [Panicum miliaceum]|uniref:Uncharacterized protein n=1 Tax=Panicum miliaceum TaxID=4540 RepID=A0A3L6QTM9_PANMI|nr:hypothetical protein C2845_PM04G19690 [Panicum miliaceum]